MKSLSRFIAGAVVLMSVAATAEPALAAGPTFYVGGCHVGGYPDIQPAVDAAELLPAAVHKTVIICPGVWNEAGTITVTTDNLTITGKKGAVVVEMSDSAELFVADGTDHFTLQKLTVKLGVGWGGGHSLIHVRNSTNARVQHVVVDGASNVGPYSNSAIYFDNSGGAILNNKVVNFHLPGYIWGVHLNGGIAIVAYSITGATLRVVGNRVIDFQGGGITLTSYSSALVTRNKVISTTVTTQPAASSGITVNLVNSGRVSNNVITGGTFPAAGSTYGLALSGVNNLRVSGNRLSHWDTGIYLNSACDPNNATNNRVTGNRVAMVNTGMQLYADAVFCLSAASHVDSNVITGNKFVDPAAMPGVIGFQVTMLSDSTHTATALNELFRHNTIAHFATPMTVPLPDPANNITGTFGPNTIIP